MHRPAHARRPDRRRRLPELGAALVMAVALTALVFVGPLGERGEEPPVAGTASAEVPASVPATSPAPTAKPARARTTSRQAVRPAPVVPGPTLKPAPRPAADAEGDAKRLAARAAREADETPAPSGEPFSVRIGTFNVLGSQHTAPGGDRRRYPPASVRTPKAAGLMAKHGVDIIGTQELQADQLRGLQSRTGMAAYPGFGWGEAETDNSILWDPSRFELVSGDQFTITFMGRPRPQPIVLLRELATGRQLYVVNTHPSAGGGRYLAERRRGQAVLVDVVNRLRASGLPVLVTGDMNDREEFYCRVVPASGMTAPNGGSYASGCQPPPYPMPVDWVVGSGVSWSDYWRDTSSTTQRISDHIFISATAHVG